MVLGEGVRRAMKSSPFNYEREMTLPVLRWLQGKGFRVLREYKTPYGYCDLVAASLHKPRMKKRLRLRQKANIGPPFRVALLLHVPDETSGKTVAPDMIYRAYRKLIPRKVIREELKVLQDRGFIREVSRQLYTRVNGWMPLHKRLVAIELKLYKVAEAVRQAIRNTEFADESYVALPESIAHGVVRSARLDRFRSSGVGLIAVSPSGCRTLLISRKSLQRPDQVTQVHCLEQFWRRAITSKAT